MFYNFFFFAASILCMGRLYLVFHTAQKKTKATATELGKTWPELAFCRPEIDGCVAEMAKNWRAAHAYTPKKVKYVQNGYKNRHLSIYRLSFYLHLGFIFVYPIFFLHHFSQNLLNLTLD
jgi:hypothetical protein